MDYIARDIEKNFAVKNKAAAVTGSGFVKNLLTASLPGSAPG